MTAQEILNYCADHVRDLQTGDAVAMAQRLYEIALFEHNVPEESSHQLLELIEELRRYVIDASINDPLLAIQFQDDCRWIIETASRVGRGSLLWKLAEERIPESQISEYIMRPHHGALLHTYFDVTGLNRVRELKPPLIINLVEQRLFPGVRDPVLTLHALAMGGDPAVAALFALNESNAFIKVPDDYDAARMVLARAGLNPGPSPLQNLPNPRSVSAIPGIVNRIVVKRIGNDQRDYGLTALHEATNLFRWFLGTLRYSLARRIVIQCYGRAVGNAFFGSLSETVRTDIEHFDAREETSLVDVRRPARSIDYLLVDGLVECYCSLNNVKRSMLQLDGEVYIKACAEFICKERAQFINHLYNSLQQWVY
jgi:hypothetical protein